MIDLIAIGPWHGLCSMSVAEREFYPGQERETDMKNLTYEIYLANPAVREQLEREARRARAEAMHQYIVAPLMRMFSQVFRRAAPRPAALLQMSV